MNGDLNNIIEVVKEVTGRNPAKKGVNKGFSRSKQIYIHIANSLNYRPSEIASHINMSLAQVYKHIKTFERASQRSPELRTQTDSCWFKVNNMLKIENFNFLDRLLFFWDNLTIKQREEITELAEKYHVNNTHAKQEIYV
jgi:hypothetical protein|tara:strand:+ start:176 stop:595 length:420 start_codon:yes stop_codon:yes gene_type:complete